MATLPAGVTAREHFVVTDQTTRSVVRTCIRISKSMHTLRLVKCSVAKFHTSFLGVSSRLVARAIAADALIQDSRQRDRDQRDGKALDEARAWSRWLSSSLKIAHADLTNVLLDVRKSALGFCISTSSIKSLPKLRSALKVETDVSMRNALSALVELLEQ